MLILITGGSASGKSEFAEQTAMVLGGRRLYIATMQPFGAEAAERIQRHHTLRAGKGFDTVEQYVSAGSTPVAGYDTVLLECLSNLLANEMYAPEGAAAAGKNPAQAVLEGIHCLSANVHLVVVTNEVFSDGIEYPEETAEYIRLLGMINQELAGYADAVAEVICGIPVWRKGHPGE